MNHRVWSSRYQSVRTRLFLPEQKLTAVATLQTRTSPYLPATDTYSRQSSSASKKGAPSYSHDTPLRSLIRIVDYVLRASCGAALYISILANIPLARYALVLLYIRGPTLTHPIHIGLLQTLDDCGSPPLASRAPTLSRPTSLRTSDRKSMMAYMGLPLDIFGKVIFTCATPEELH